MGKRDTTANWKQVTKIHGRPSFLQLRKLEKELTINASKVQSDLGGGMHGHLGMIKSPEDYTTIAPGQPYIFPAQPPPLEIPAGTTQAATFTLQQHMLDTEKFKEAMEVKKALGHQLTEAIDSEYMAEFLDEHTNNINQLLHQVATRSMHQGDQRVGTAETRDS